MSPQPLNTNTKSITKLFKKKKKKSSIEKAIKSRNQFNLILKFVSAYQHKNLPNLQPLVPLEKLFYLYTKNKLQQNNSILKFITDFITSLLFVSNPYVLGCR